MAQDMVDVEPMDRCRHGWNLLLQGLESSNGVYNVEASHDIMITHPNELAEILLQIADKVHVFRNEKMKR